MAAFEQHVNVAVVGSGVLIIPLHISGTLDIEQSVIALCLGIVGGVLPDLDSDNSKPIQIIFKLISIFLPLLILLFFGGNIGLIYIVPAWIILTFLIHITLFKLLLSLTVHRGIFHSIPMGFLVGQLTTLVFYKLFHIGLEFSQIAGFFIFYGFMVHLFLDELYSINAMGMKMKKSFGTALKLYSQHNFIGFIALYVIIGTLYFYMPSIDEMYIKLFNTLKTIKIV